MAGTSTEGNTDVSATNAGQLDPDAFKKLYPENFYQKYIDIGIRPDGRAFGRARPTTIGLGAVETADASALVKIGSTTVLAGIKLEVGSECVWWQMLQHKSDFDRPSRQRILLAIWPPCTSGSQMH